MWDSLAYEHQNFFLQSMHTLVNLFYITVLFIIGMSSDHPLFLIGVFMITLLNLAAVGALTKGEKILQAGIWITLLIMIINPLVIHAGETILWLGPELPVLGQMTISLEAISYGAAMGFRLMTLLIIFCLYNEIVDPDRLLSRMSRLAFKSGLILSMATRLFPLVLRELRNAREVQQLRGVDFDGGNLRVRIRKYAWVFQVVMVSTLEGSFQTAEAMQARAFGSGPRTCYRREQWRPRDLICLGTSFLALGMMVYAKFKGYCDFGYYPRLGSLMESSSVTIWLAGILFCLAVPVALSWGWEKSSLVKSKI